MKMNRTQMLEYIKLLRKTIKRHEKTIKRHEEAMSYIQTAHGSITRLIEDTMAKDHQDRRINVTDTPITPAGSSSDDSYCASSGCSAWALCDTDSDGGTYYARKEPI